LKLGTSISSIVLRMTIVYRYWVTRVYAMASVQYGTFISSYARKFSILIPNENKTVSTRR